MCLGLKPMRFLCHPLFPRFPRNKFKTKMKMDKYKNGRFIKEKILNNYILL